MFKLKTKSKLILWLALIYSTPVLANTYLFREILPNAVASKPKPESFDFTVPGTYNIPIPAGETIAEVTAIGGGGGSRFYTGGSGSKVSGSIPLNGISDLTVIVGGGGGAADCGCGGGGGGGGLSAVCSGSSCNTNSVLILASGGGGSNGDTSQSSDNGLSAVSPDGVTTGQGGGAGGPGFGGGGLGSQVSGSAGTPFGADTPGPLTSACNETPPSDMSEPDGDGLGGFGGGGEGGSGYGGGGGGGGLNGGQGGGESNNEGGDGGASYWASIVQSPDFSLTSNGAPGCTNTSGWGNNGGNGSVSIDIK